MIRFQTLLARFLQQTSTDLDSCTFCSSKTSYPNPGINGHDMTSLSVHVLGTLVQEASTYCNPNLRGGGLNLATIQNLA